MGSSREQKDKDNKTAKKHKKDKKEKKREKNNKKAARATSASNDRADEEQQTSLPVSPVDLTSGGLPSFNVTIGVCMSVRALLPSWLVGCLRTWPQALGCDVHVFRIDSLACCEGSSASATPAAPAMPSTPAALVPSAAAEQPATATPASTADSDVVDLDDSLPGWGLPNSLNHFYLATPA